jgi:myo-inositol-1-phosphate synthase
VIDAVRCCKLALDRGLGGTLEGPAAYFMKSPPVQHSDERARQLVEAFIAAAGAPAPGGEGAAPTRARGDEVGVEDVHRSTV